MTTVAEGLVHTIRALPQADKTIVIGHLLEEDADIREAVAELLIKKLAGPVRYKKNEDLKSHGNGGATGPSPRESGKRARESYVSELEKRGIQINQIDNAWAKTATRHWVALRFATERQPNRWWHGLPVQKVRERIKSGGLYVVLLCQTAAGVTLDFVFPPSIVQEVVNLLTKSGTQLILNIKRDGNRYYLLIPSRSPLDVTDYKGEVSVFRS